MIATDDQIQGWPMRHGFKLCCTFKAVDRGMTITDVKLLEKHGGKSGSFVAEK
jgi:hypothetical protein